MKKQTEKETLEQETEEVTEEQDRETETDTEEAEEENQEQEESAEGETETEEQTEESEQTEETDEAQEDTQQETPAGTDPEETADLRQQLLEARGRNAAYAAGVAHGMVDDAVTLAMAEAAKSGEVTEAAVSAAMEAVLKRHPEWKADAGDKKKTGGFKIGADRDSGGSFKKQNNTTQNVKRWNRFK